MTLHDAFAADRADRRSKEYYLRNWRKVTKRDAVRLRLVRSMLARARLKKATDFLKAAYILQHGRTPEDYATAHLLAKEAGNVRVGAITARFLRQAAHDRFLWSIGCPQRYGTQYRLSDSTERPQARRQ
jgi:hypothetical protein